jgi:hypothetical protein
MTTNITSDKWRGERAAPIDPASVRFTAIESLSNDCRGCMFNSQRGTVCDKANVIAERAGMPKCCTKPEYIYVLDPSPQMWLVEVDAE